MSIKSFLSLFTLTIAVMTQASHASANEDYTTYNHALNGLASQSSTDWGGIASRAIDGNTSGDYSKASITHTSTAGQPWWQVELAQWVTINRVRIYNRTNNCCASRLDNFVIQLSNDPYFQNIIYQTNNQRYFGGASKDFNIPNVRAKYVRVRLQTSDTNPLSLAEVEVYGEASLVNLSLHKQASQSSTAYGGNANRAVDNNLSGIWSHQSVTHTDPNNASPAWWQVDLGAQYKLHSVLIRNRTDCCANRLKNFVIQLSNDPNFPQASIIYQTAFATGLAPQGKFALDLTEARYLRIQLRNPSTPLSLADVSVLGYKNTIHNGEDSHAVNGTQRLLEVKSRAIRGDGYQDSHSHEIGYTTDTRITLANTWLLHTAPDEDGNDLTIARNAQSPWITLKLRHAPTITPNNVLTTPIKSEAVSLLARNSKFSQIHGNQVRFSERVPNYDLIMESYDNNSVAFKHK